MVLYEHMNILSAVTVNALQIYLFKRAARTTACNSNLGTVITVIGVTRALPMTNPKSAN